MTPIITGTLKLRPYGVLIFRTGRKCTLEVKGQKFRLAPKTRYIYVDGDFQVAPLRSGQEVS